MLKNNFNKYICKTNLFIRLFSLIFVIILVLYCPLYHQFTLIQLFKGIIGNLSVVSLCLLIILLMCIVFSNKLLNMSAIFNYHFAIILVILAGLIYLSTFDFIPFDLYSLGYFPNQVTLICFGIIGFYFWYYARLYAWIWLIALISFYFKILPSNNLCDYLFDPLLWLVFCGWLIVRLFYNP